MQQEVHGSVSGAEVDYRHYPLAQKLLQRCQDFFAEVENLLVHHRARLFAYIRCLRCFSPLTGVCRTPGKDLEAYLNKNYGPGTPIYEDLCSLTRQGLEEGWVANTAIDGPHYRRSKISLPKEETRFFSITAVYVDSQQGEFSGQHHSHPYGEINCVVQIDEGSELKGMQGWQGAGWTSPGPGTHQ